MSGIIDSAPIVEAPPDAPPLDVSLDEILVAEDHPGSLHMLERYLNGWGFRVRTATDGEEALQILDANNAPPIAIIDWNMPKVDGLTVCTRTRERSDRPYTYLLLLTARNKTGELMKGLESGADDFVTKPFDAEELHSRIRVGQRVARLERTLQAKVARLEATLAQAKRLKALLPICTYCKCIRDDQSYWHQVDQYIHDVVGTDFSHGICPQCVDRFFDKKPVRETTEF